MLQQTQVKTVIPYYLKFLERFPDIEHLACADLQDILKVWEGLGYYGRAHHLHRAAKIILEQHHGVIPGQWKEFRKLPGVGDYIASAVLSIAFARPYAVLDGNVKRVLARLFQMAAPVNHASAHKLFKPIADRLLDPQHPGLFNQALMELGALVCRPQKPECSQCPIRSICRAYSHRQVDAYPKRAPSRPIPQYAVAVGVVWKNNRVLITRRKPDGLLGGLWEFPGGKIQKGESAQDACIREIREEVSLRVEITHYLTQIKHAYTHFRIVMDIFLCRYLSGRVKLNQAVAHRWIRLKEIDDYPFPGANQKFIPLLKGATVKREFI